MFLVFLYSKDSFFKKLLLTDYVHELQIRPRLKLKSSIASMIFWWDSSL